MAPPVRAGINKRYVVAATGSRRGERIERTIWGCAGRRATELARSLPLSAFAERGTGGEDSALRRGGRGVRFRAHVSPPGAPRGGSRHDVRRPDRALRDGARVGDRVLEAGVGAAGDGCVGCAGRDCRECRGAACRAPATWDAHADDARGPPAGGAFLVLDRLSSE